MPEETKCPKRRFRVGKSERYEGDRFTPIEERFDAGGKMVWLAIAHTRNDKGNRDAKFIVSTLAENERLKESLSAVQSERHLLADYHTTAMCERDEAREQLTAMEAKLSEAMRIISFGSYRHLIIQSMNPPQCLSGCDACKKDAFLSTLTAEKKETTMNNRTISVDELQCVCGNAQNILIKIPTNIRIAVCSACHNEWPIGAVIEPAEKKEEAK